MLPYGPFPQSTNLHGNLPVSPHDTSPSSYLAAGGVNKSQVKAKPSQVASLPKALKMKKKAKVKFVVTDEQLEKLAGILCDLFHEEAATAAAEPRESMTALLA